VRNLIRFFNKRRGVVCAVQRIDNAAIVLHRTRKANKNKVNFYSTIITRVVVCTLLYAGDMAEVQLQTILIGKHF